MFVVNVSASYVVCTCVVYESGESFIKLTIFLIMLLHSSDFCFIYFE
jgi:hypothetical protein